MELRTEGTRRVWKGVERTERILPSFVVYIGWLADLDGKRCGRHGEESLRWADEEEA